MTRCSHYVCKREAEEGSLYCNPCLKNPTTECSECDKDPERMSPGRKHGYRFFIHIPDQTVDVVAETQGSAFKKAGEKAEKELINRVTPTAPDRGQRQ